MRVLFRDQTIMSRAAAMGRRLGATFRGPVLWLTVCGGLLVAAIFAGTIMMIGEFRERALGNGERELENTVLLLTRHFDQQFDDSDTIAADVISRLRVSGHGDHPRTSGNGCRRSDAHEILRSKAGVLSYLGDISIYDLNGHMINWSRPLPVPNLNISERTYFRTFKSDPQSPAVRTEAIRSLMNGNLNTIIAHRLSGENGTFLGVMTRRIDPANYERFLLRSRWARGLPSRCSITDGTLMARYPHVDQMVGQKFKSAPLMERVLSQGGQQTLRVRSPVDNTDRLGSAARLSRFPIVVIATNSVSAALEDWREQTRFLVTAAMLSAVVIALILFLITRQITLQNREAQQRLESERHRLDTALNNMIQGLVMYDASGRIVTVNQRYIDMFDLSPDVVKPGCHFHDLIQHRKDRGCFDGDVDEFCSRILRNIARGQIDHSTMLGADGHAFLAISKPLAHSGWIATIEDITERRKLEQERDRNYAFLSQIVDHIPTQITVKGVHDRRYLLVNRVAEAHFGMSRDLIVGKTAHDIFPQTSADIITADDEKTLQSPDGLFKDEHIWESRTMGRRLHHLQADRDLRSGRRAQLRHSRRRRRHRAPARRRKDRASGAL